MASYNPWRAGGLPWLNVAQLELVRDLLGPGLRGVVLVQGCRRRCPGCIAEDWLPFKPAHLVRPEEVVDLLLRDVQMSGLTFSGGEPMLQAAGLAELVRLVRQQRGVNVICFSGYRLEQLRRQPPGPGVADLLGVIDVLIDGPYRHELDDDKGLRGSSNQRIHFLTPALEACAADFACMPRHAKIYIEDDVVTMIGVPPANMVQAVERALRKQRKEPDHEFG